MKRILWITAMALLVPTSAWAQITGGTGPGGVGTTNGTSNLHLWLRGDQGVYTDSGVTPAPNGGAIQQWNDRSGYNNHATQNTVPTTDNPTFVSSLASMNNQAVVNFGGGATNQHISLPNATTLGIANSAYEMFIVGRSTVGGVQFLVGGAIEDFELHLDGSAGSRFIPDALKYSDQGAVGAYTNSAPHIFAPRVFGTGPNYSGVNRTDGTDTADVETLTAYSSTTASTLVLGQRGDGSFDLSGQMGDVIIFNTALNGVQRTMVDNYLASRYGMTTLNAAVDKYAGDTALNGNYDFGVFGIGRDATSTVNSSGHEGFGINASGNSSLDVGEFVLAGHKVPTNSLTTVGFPHGERWSRTWYVDTNLGTVAADLAFDFTDAGLSGTLDPTDAYQLLFSSVDNPASYQVLATNFSPTGDRVVFSNIALQNGYYTLGIIATPEPASLISFAFVGVAALGFWWCRSRRAAVVTHA